METTNIIIEDNSVDYLINRYLSDKSDKDFRIILDIILDAIDKEKALCFNS